MKLNKDMINRFLQYTIYHLLPVTEQEHWGKGKSFWNRDYTEIEVLKCLLIGNSRYRGDPIPYRARGNDNFSIEEFIKIADKKRELFLFLEANKDKINSLVINNCGRGIDLLIAFMVKEYPEIQCFDLNLLYEPLIKGAFRREHIKFIVGDVSEKNRRDYLIPKDSIIINESIEEEE